MIAFFCLISILSFVSMSVWIALLNKIEENEKKKKSITYKVKKFFKPKEEIIKEPKYTKQQIIIFLVASILSLCISVTGAVIHGIASEEKNNNEINNEIVINKNIVNETDEKLETTEDKIKEEVVENNVVEENTNSATNEVVKENTTTNNTAQQLIESKPAVSTNNIPAYSGKPYITINNNVPYFTDKDLTTTSYEYYSNLDSLGRCGVAVANIGKDIMPTGERGDIGSVKPTGWHTIKYDNVSGKYLYNRCHLIGYQLSGENANTKNLITGTRYLNVEGMLPFENMVDDYIEETNNHVLYRVTPIFEGNNLLASGVLIEAKSVEDNGAGILFNVYCYNIQPGINIDYSTGESSSSSNATNNSSSSTGATTPVVEEPKQETTTPSTSTNEVSQTYILNKNTKKFHEEGCGSASRISEKNKGTYTGSRDELISQGYSPCGNCEP